MTKEQLKEMQVALSVEFKCVVCIMDMLRRGEISASTMNIEVYEKVLRNIEQPEDISEEYKQRLGELMKL